MEGLGFAAALLMGVTLGVLGGGGSILTVPILVYLFGVRGSVATFYSLLIVGVSAGVGLIAYVRRGQVHVRTGLLFLLPAWVGLMVSRQVLLPAMPEQSKDVTILLAFALVMLGASWSMLRKKIVKAGKASLGQTLVLGGAVGIVTGFVGAGGGFLIVPALVNGLGLSMAYAVGTSLLIIALNSLAGFFGDLLRGAVVDWSLIGPFLVFALVGVGLGTWINPKVPAARLKPAFGWFVLVVGSVMLIAQVRALL